MRVGLLEPMRGMSRRNGRRGRILVLAGVMLLAIALPAAPAAAAPPANDVFGEAVVIDPGSLPFSTSQDTTDATTDADDAEIAALCPGGGPPFTDASVWYAFTPAITLQYSCYSLLWITRQVALYICV